jgi:hypothetical protein
MSICDVSRTTNIIIPQIDLNLGYKDIQGKKYIKNIHYEITPLVAHEDFDGNGEMVLKWDSHSD